MIESISISGSTRSVPRVDNSSRRFQWLKQYARGITKRVKEKRSSESTTSHTVPKNVPITRLLEPSGSVLSFSRQKKVVASTTERCTVPAPGVLQVVTNQEIERCTNKEMKDPRVSTGTQSSIVQLSTAFRDTVCSESIPAWALPQHSPQPPDLSPQPNSPPMSPSFLNPRQAPRPPPTTADEANPYDSKASFTDATEPDLSSKHSFGSLDVKRSPLDISLSTSSSSACFPSTGSGLERIGAALLDYAQTPHIEYIPDASYSSLDDQSLGYLLETMERHSIFVCRTSKRTSNRSTTTFSIPSIQSAPENLVDSCASLEDLRRRSSHSFIRSLHIKSGTSISLSETSSSIEHLLRGQGVTVPSPRDMTELWNTLSIGTTREGARVREILQSITECELEDVTISTSLSCPGPAGVAM